ncbi:MAG: hypothetical protein JWM53_5972, partial [bacterium]|nr:hypothetical protein [bacterium]
VTLDGAAPAAKWPDTIAHKSPGAPLVLGATRGARPLELHLTLAAEHEMSCKLTPATATPAITALRERLLTP